MEQLGFGQARRTRALVAQLGFEQAQRIESLPILDEYEDVPPRQFRASFATTQLDHRSALDIHSVPCHFRRTAIICTIGPRCKTVPFLMKMLFEGMDVARLNFSHGSYNSHAEIIKNVKEAIKPFRKRKVVAIALDTKGPEVRTGILKGGASAKVYLKTGATINVTTTDENILYVDYKNIIKVMKVGDRILIDDGHISVIVKEIGSDFLKCEIEYGGLLGSRKSCHLHGIPLDLPAVSVQDKEDLLFGVKYGVDMIFASYISEASTVREIRRILGERGKYIKVFAKIQNRGGVKNFDEILEEADGVLIGRGNLALEIPPEKVVLVQKMMIAKCNKACKPIICAEQMLGSMVENPRPTRAEAGDVANAVIDGADCLMLSEETSIGLYPFNAIKLMSKISREAECVVRYYKLHQDLKKMTLTPIDTNRTVAIATVDISFNCYADAIIVVTTSDVYAHLIAAYRPQCPIIVVAGTGRVARQALMYNGVLPIHYGATETEADWTYDMNMRVHKAFEIGAEKHIIRSGHPTVVVMGWAYTLGLSHLIRIIIAP